MKSFFKQTNVIGINIGTNELTMMCFEKKSKSSKLPRIISYSSVELDPAESKKSLEKDDGYLEEKIKTLIENSSGKANAKYAFVAIPTINTFSKTIQLPIKIKNDLDNAIKLEVEQYVPIPIELLSVSYDVISEDDKELNVSMVATPVSIINKVLQIVRSLDLEPVLIEPSMNSIARLLINTEKGDLNTLIIDIGLDYTDMAILEKIIRVSSSIEIGGNHFTKQISKDLGITPEKADQLKMLSGFSKSQYQEEITKSLRPKMDIILAEIKKMMRYNNERLKGASIDQILVVGNGSNIPGLSDYLINELRMPVRIANPWQEFHFHKITSPNKAKLSHFLTVAGMAWLNPKEVIND